MLDLYMRRGPFWEAVRDVRDRWNISARTQLPPEGVRGGLLPQGAPDFDNDRSAHMDYALQWGDEMLAVRDSVVPGARQRISRIHDDHRFELSWQQFLSACVLYDPPEDRLLEFASYGRPEPTYLTGGKLILRGTQDLPRMVDPPVRSLWDLSTTGDWYWQRVLDHIIERYLNPQGVDVEELIEHAVICVPGLRQEYEERFRRYSERYFIEVDEYTTSEDLHSALRLVRSTTPRRSEGSRPPRDPLLAVQCAVLHGRDCVDQEGKRRRWTYQSLADCFGLSSDRAAKAHVLQGREILNSST